MYQNDVLYTRRTGSYPPYFRNKIQILPLSLTYELDFEDTYYLIIPTTEEEEKYERQKMLDNITLQLQTIQQANKDLPQFNGMTTKRLNHLANRIREESEYPQIPVESIGVYTILVTLLLTLGTMIILGIIKIRRIDSELIQLRTRITNDEKVAEEIEMDEM